MNNKKTIAIFGAGPGLGTSLANCFGHENYKVALVARRADPLKEQVNELTRNGIESDSFPADLTKLDTIPTLIQSIEQRLGPIDVAVYCPAPAEFNFVPAAELDASRLQSMATIFTFSPIEVSHSVLSGMLSRGNGAIIIVSGLSAVVPMPGLSGVGPLMAAARNYIFSLNAEVMPKGIYAGTVSIGALIERSTFHRGMIASGVPLDPKVPLINPDDVAQEIFSLTNKRDRVEVILPPMSENAAENLDTIRLLLNMGRR